MKIKTLFISDIHLGNPNSQPDKLLSVLKKYKMENLYIVGDFIDLTYLKRKFYWNDNHTKVIKKILKLSKEGVNVTYIVGNHDFYIREIFDEYVDGIKFGDIKICDDDIYTKINGEKIYITHGDCFDGFIHTNKFLYLLGDMSYEFAIKINRLYNYFRKLLGMQYWSLSSYLKTKVKNIIKFLNEYEQLSEKLVSTKKCDSIMIGHTHTPFLKVGKYYNCGDFCETCSYIIEKKNGEMELLFFVK